MFCYNTARQMLASAKSHVLHHDLQDSTQSEDWRNTLNCVFFWSITISVLPSNILVVRGNCWSVVFVERVTALGTVNVPTVACLFVCVFAHQLQQQGGVCLCILLPCLQLC